MTKILLSILFCLFLLTGFSQKRPLKAMEHGDTLTMEIEKIASLYGLDSRVIIKITRTDKTIKVSIDNDQQWMIITDEQFDNLKKFERVGIKKGCYSTQYVQVQARYSNKNTEKRYRTCWKNLDSLMEKLK